MNTLVHSIRARNGNLWLEGERLRYDVPRGVLGDADKAALREQREAVIELLIAEQEGNQRRRFSYPLENCEPATLKTGTFGEKGFLLVQSKILGGEVIVCAEDALELPLDEHGLLQGRLVYRESELRRLTAARPSASALAFIHASKKGMA
ncbi:hypothetical protein LBMAG21_07330 [Armatimonadota bacterium]|nr:hypothetical protein LBMAG21_07330 [Armatimonadota bacterium]